VGLLLFGRKLAYMPWSEKDVERHKHGLGPAEKTKWAKIANHVYGHTHDEGESIATANKLAHKRRVKGRSVKR
jgi:hypothetical protein